MTYKRKKYHNGDTHLKKGWRTRRRTKDLDQINEDLKDKNVKNLLNQEVDLNKPGAGQYYCIHCARHFINNTALQDHFSTKVHKRRLKALELEPYTIEESEKAAGKGNYIAPQKRKIETITADSFKLDTEPEFVSQAKIAKVNFIMENCLRHFIRTYMSHNILRANAFKYANTTLKFNRQYTSALFVSGRKGMEVFSFLTPYLDFDHQLENIEKLQRVLTFRGLNIDAKDIKQMWQFYKLLTATESKLELRSKTISVQMTEFNRKKSLTDKEHQELIALKLQAKVLKQDLKSIKNVIWDLDDSIIEKMLKLPNKVDQRTPSQLPVVIKRSGALHESSGNKKDHIEIGRRLGLLEYQNPMQYYLCNDAAFFELGVLNYAGKIFSANNMIKVTGSDFSRSLVVEGSTLNHENPFDAFVIDNHTDVEKNSVNRMHLVGGASLISFLAMHAKQLINPKHFPIQYFSTGRQYTPFPIGSTPIGLFTVCQASAAHAFVLVKDANSPNHTLIFENLLNTVSELYDSVCDHYQIIIRPVSDLRPWETMRVSFELWSSFSKQYIEVGHISVCGNYLSKRLLIAYQTPTGRDFPSIITGTVFSVPRLLGCLLEQNPDKFVIPPKVAEYIHYP